MLQKPLAEILRPTTIESYVGQEHLMGEGGILRNAIEQDTLHSMILWGPPGVGKTTLALLMAELTGSDFYMLSAISSGVKDIRDVFEKARNSEKKSILFIDEIHRFSKAQQDSLLGAVERGVVTLIGATTENPSFEVIAPLLSRCQVYILKNLELKDLEKILETARLWLEKEFKCKIEIIEKEALLRVSGGDARKLINAIELVGMMSKPVEGIITVTNQVVLKIIQKNLAIYDKKGENHYDIISAFIKSIRGSDPNAAVYWMARMLVAGEDPLFIARRMIVLASEDIGNANPNALLLANSCFQAVHQIGMPEARIVLSQTAVYLASSPKSNASYMAIDDAFAWVEKTGDLPVPLHLRNAPTQLMKDIGYHEGYKYAHKFENNFVELDYLPQSISGKKFYEPQDNPRENELRNYLKKCWKDKYKYVILLLISLFSMKFSWTQDFHYSQFYASPINMNPALTGVFDGIFRLGINQKTQWLSVSKPFVTVSGIFDMPVYKNNSRRELLGLGLNFSSDQAGDSKFRSLQVNISASYVRGLDRRNKHKLGIGFYAGIAQRSINYAELYFDEQFQNGYFDPTNPITEMYGMDNFVYFDWGAGSFWSYSPNKTNSFSLGYSAGHLSRANQTLYENEAKLNIKHLVFFSSKFNLSNHLQLQPMAFAAFQGSFQEICFGSNIEYFVKKNSYSTQISLGGGLFYRWNDALMVVGMVEWKNIRIGVSYDINVSSFVTATNVRGGFEFSLIYIYKKSTLGRMGKEPCPFDIM